MQEKSDTSEKEEGEETFPNTGAESEGEAETETGKGTEPEAETEAKPGTEEKEEEKSGEQEEEIPLFSMRRRLTKSKTNKILTGVCGGIGEYFDIDPTIVRISFVALAFFSGIGIVIYIILAVIMPEGNGVEAQTMNSFEEGRERNGGTVREVKSDRMRLLGGVLLIIGIYLFLDRFRIFEMFWWVNKFFWPAVFTVAGAWLLLRNSE